ncbi:hypothetical protein MTR67_039528 [Solanum verrucosum]|uniref:Uncharacterized protein n=1 Tax=Solanum verrucosum TaxID=315347 RepID=A0AAF0ZQH2_SOLVR|nr:hypothetical protein MTR67_039528 [Solanum verrucosum]
MYHSFWDSTPTLRWVFFSDDDRLLFKLVLSSSLSIIRFFSLEMRGQRSKMSKFISRVSEMVVMEHRTAMLIKEMYISRLMIHVQQIEQHKLKERSREEKKTKTSDGDFSHTRFDRHVHS